MSQLLARLLLSVALIVQGIGPACAGGSVMMDMAQSASMTGDMTGPAKTAAPVKVCAHASCPGCPSGHPVGGDCLQSCGVPASLPCLIVFLPHTSPGNAWDGLPQVSLVDFIQAPPTPPPIA